jgi:hypothetical protein
LIIGESFFIWKQNSHVVNFLNGDSRVVLKLFDKGKKMGRVILARELQDPQSI